MAWCRDCGEPMLTERPHRHPLCACRHSFPKHNGPEYATGLGTSGKGCDVCGCAYFAPAWAGAQFDGNREG